jgi:hypothetical protein
MLLQGGEVGHFLELAIAVATGKINWLNANIKDSSSPALLTDIKRTKRIPAKLGNG